MSVPLDQQLMGRIKVLSEKLWEDHCTEPDILRWLNNFDGRYEERDTEQLHALHLLSSMSYFGLRELRVLLRALYRDHFRYPLIQKARSDLGGTRDSAAVNSEFLAQLSRTRFLGMGNPAESGTHLLYYFRQENRLDRSLFVHQHELLTSAATDPDVELAIPDLEHLVFIDDLCGSGEQSVRYSRTILRQIRDIAARTAHTIHFHYLVLFGTEAGMDRARAESEFDEVSAVSLLDDTYATFGETSRVFRKSPPDIDRAISERVARGYGSELWPAWPLGYEDNQLLIAFHHNVPDNSLPIIWYDEGSPPWHPALARQPKIG